MGGEVEGLNIPHPWFPAKNMRERHTKRPFASEIFRCRTEKEDMQYIR